MSAASDTTRLFIALWPDCAVRESLARCRDAWAFPDSSVPVASERLHLTLHFLGELAQSCVPALAKGLQVPFEPFDLCFGRTALWAHGVAVVEPDALPPRLLALHAALASRLQGLSLPPEDRTFRPHVTLARRAERAPPPDCSAAHWHVHGYALVESRSGHRGGYRVLRRYE